MFNAIFKTSHTVQSVNTHLWRIGITLKTDHHKRGCTQEQKDWLISNFSKYDYDFVLMAKEFNNIFGTNRSNCSIAKYCERNLKLYKPRPKRGQINKGTFVKGNKTTSTERQLPVGTIRQSRRNHKYIPVIKVQMCDGNSGSVGHNYKKPWWIPLKDKIFQDFYGNIPDGYSVVNLDGDSQNCDIKNLALLDKRGAAIMMNKDWWSDNRKFTGTAVQWCNLYMIAKDNSVL